MNAWPTGDRVSLDAFYGSHRLGPDGLPTHDWEIEQLVMIRPAYAMWAAWDSTIAIERIRCHRLVAESLLRILREVRDSTWPGRGAYGGCYNYRTVRGNPTVLSTHSWGIAIDLDPGPNALGRKWTSAPPMIPMEIVEIFQKEGWTWGGNFRRPDCMHFEATSRST